MTDSHPWCLRLLAPLPDEMIPLPISADNPIWETVDTELVKLGSLAHSQVDLNKVADQCLSLFETQTKDMRVLAHLLRCLQHPANVASFTTALLLLDCWIQAYWVSAWPVNPQQKLRIFNQIIKRFEGILARVCHSASSEQIEHLLNLTLRLQQHWLELVPNHGVALEALLAGLYHIQRHQQEQAHADKANIDKDGNTQTKLSTPQQSAFSVSPIPVSVSSNAQVMNSCDDRQWRSRQMQMAELLIEQQPESPIGYRLRRNALWHGITAPPLISKGNKTPLSPMSPDRINEYQTALSQADQTLWEQIEQSLTLSPYWFDGHHLSAQVAVKLGYGAVAIAMAEELAAFLNRLPLLRELTFSDGSPFLGNACIQWLQTTLASSEMAGKSNPITDLQRCFQSQGLVAALTLLNDRLSQLKEPRARFYHQLAGADLLAAEGMPALAAQQYQTLWQEAQSLGLAQWEPGLVTRLAHYATLRSN
ncbi:MAG: type VI secretion system protein TssA [Plesiomonas sp.]